LFGAEGALIVGGVALATLVFFAGILTLDRDRWLAISLAAALIAALAVFVGMAWLKESHHKGGKPAAASHRDNTDHSDATSHLDATGHPDATGELDAASELAISKGLAGDGPAGELPWRGS
jgi:hypothetical protein